MTIKSSVAILYGPRSAEYNIRMNEATIRHRNLTEIPAWQRLAAHYRDRPFDLAAMFAQDPRRAHTLSAHCGEVLLDYSKNLLDAETLRLLIELARERDLAGAIGRLFSGEPVNVSENRAALHTALRSESPVHLDGRDITVSIKTEIDRMRTFVESIRAAKTVTDVIHIGIGGARLGAAFAGDALQAYATTPLRVHYLSTVDGGALQQLLARLDPKYTLIIVASKTFTTAETQANAHAVRDWMAGKLGGEQAALAKFSAVTARPEIAEAFGIARENIFATWDWVGGRYSMCSAMALPLALQIGMAHFDDLRAGARAMDAHFQSAALDQNLPVILALLDVWYANFHGTTSRVVLPYLSGFKRFPAFLQQIEMESLGKRVDVHGNPVCVNTGLVVWGESGTNGQHAFLQLLHQGTRLIPAEFIFACRARHQYPAHHEMLAANALAQAEALMTGKPASDPHRVYPGNRPSTTLVLPEADPYHLGLLVALYEHKTYVESVIWGINAFDQWGVEYGKKIAATIQSELDARAIPGTHDASTRALIDHFKTQSRRPA